MDESGERVSTSAVTISSTLVALSVLGGSRETGWRNAKLDPIKAADAKRR